MVTLATYQAPDIPLQMLYLTEFSHALGSRSHDHSPFTEEETRAQEGLVQGSRCVHAN